MQIQVEQVSDIKTDQRGVSSKIKAGNDYYYVNEDATPLIGKLVEIEFTEKTSAKGNKYKVANILKTLEKAASNGHGISWDDYRHMAEAAHVLAKELEPDTLGPSTEDGPSVITVDRSAARAAIINTCLIAYSNGKITLSVQDDDIPW